MPKVFYGRRGEQGFDLEQSNDLLAVRTRSGFPITRTGVPVPTPESTVLEDANLVVAYPEAGVEVYRVPVTASAPSIDDRKRALRGASDVRFAGGVLVDPVTQEPVLYTENLFVKFAETTDPEDCLRILHTTGLTVKNEVTYATNAYFVAAREGSGQAVFEIAEQLLRDDAVEYCHPELIRLRVPKAILPNQWHLKKTQINGIWVDAHVQADAAHELSRGAGVVIAVIDDGVDVDHPEFGTSSKVVAPRDATLRNNDSRPKTFGDNHGTPCAGVACASGVHGASGVAPDARLMPIRLSSAMGSQREAEAFQWAADHGADIISCSWGPPDGQWWNPDDPRHNHAYPLPTNTRLAMDYAANVGRGGRGCVILFAAGNGNESVDLDGYASYEKVIAVAACNDRGTRSVYSDFGKAVWCCFPSSDFAYAPFDHPAPLTSGIWTTDRRGDLGLNPGNLARGDAAGYYVRDFGGTSSSCPGVAGVVALVLAVNPNLKWHEVRDLLRSACERIDPQGGGYDATGHSPRYGYGRINARRAVELAQPQPKSEISIRRVFDAPIPDLQTVSFSLEISDPTPVEELSVFVDIKHTYIGDLILTLHPPTSLGIPRIILQQRQGGATRDLKRSYDSSEVAGLGQLTGRNCQGTWTLTIQDAAAWDSGTLHVFGLDLTFAHPSRNVPSARNPDPIRRTASTRKGAPRSRSKPRRKAKG